jgi:hypothetical protein
MHDCQKIEAQLIDLVFDELPEAQRASLLADVEACAHCCSEYQTFKATLSTFDEAADLLLPDEAYWPGYEARLRAKLASAEPVSRWQKLIEFKNAILFRPAWGVAVSVVLLLALAFWFWYRQPMPSPDQPIARDETPSPQIQSGSGKEKAKDSNPVPGSTDGGTTDPQSPENRQRENRGMSNRRFERGATYHKPAIEPQNRQPQYTPVIASASEYDYLVRSLANDETVKHFEKAQNLLRDFRNLEVSAEVASADIADEKTRSRSLLLKNVLLRREAETRSNLPIEQVLSALEPLLIDIAHLPDKAPPSEIRAIRERIERKEMIGKLQLYSTRPVIAETALD